MIKEMPLMSINLFIYPLGGGPGGGGKGIGGLLESSGFTIGFGFLGFFDMIFRFYDVFFYTMPVNISSKRTTNPGDQCDTACACEFNKVGEPDIDCK